MAACASCPPALSAKLGACAACTRIAVAGTAVAWAAVLVFAWAGAARALEGLTAVVAAQFTVLLLAHAVTFALRAVARRRASRSEREIV